MTALDGTCKYCDDGVALTSDGFHLKRTGYYARCGKLPPYKSGSQAPVSSNQDSTELYYAEMEAARNTSEAAYFDARPLLDREGAPVTAFRAGFERAFQLLWNRGSVPETSALRPCGCHESYPQLQPGRINHAPDCVNKSQSSRPFLQCRFCKRTTTREDRGDTYGSYCGVKLVDGGPCPGIMALYPADASAVKASARRDVFDDYQGGDTGLNTDPARIDAEQFPEGKS